MEISNVHKQNTNWIIQQISCTKNGFKNLFKIHVQNSIAQLVERWTYISEFQGSIPAQSVLEKILKLMLFLRSLWFDPGWLLYILKMLA